HGQLPHLTGLIGELVPHLFVVEAHANGFDGGGFLHRFHHRGEFRQVRVVMAAGALMLAHDHSLPEDFSALLTLADGAASPVTPGAPFAASATTRRMSSDTGQLITHRPQPTQEYAPS